MVDVGDGGVEIVDDWDPLGMRGTVSRTLLLAGPSVCRAFGARGRPHGTRGANR